MAAPSRYNITAIGAGVEGDVLKNRLGITDQQTLNDTETILLTDTYNHFIALLEKGKIRYDLSLLFKIHLYFLVPLYSWAGKIRTVDISKDGVHFASSRYLSDSIKTFQPLFLQNIPALTDTKVSIAKKLAFIHIELNALHPFREGNGRTIRLLIDVLALHAGYLPIDWSKRKHETYINACIAGMTKEYRPMENIITAGLTKNHN